MILFKKQKNLLVPTDSLLFTIDIDSLYTNIETTEGIKAVKDCMLRFPDSKRPDKYILKLLEINLTKNDFEFDSISFTDKRHGDGQNVCSVIRQYIYGLLGNRKP